MSASNRAAKINKLSKVLKKHFQPVKPPSDRTVLEHLLYACCLENADFEQADEAFARLQESYFDWNEVRVTTVAELTESMGCLPDPSAAAMRLKSALHSVFEGQYSFDLDFLRKENLGKAVSRLEGNKGVTPFVVAYVSQNGLNGHAIPIDAAAISLALVIDLITDKEASKGAVPGLERAIPKTKGVEFASMFHKLAVEYHNGPFKPEVRKIVLEIDPDAKDRFAKRGGKKSAESEAATDESSKSTKASSKKAAPKKAAPKKATTAKEMPKQKTPTKKAASPAKKKATKKNSIVKNAGTREKKSATKTLARKKPR